MNLKSARTIFFGTPDFAVPSLQKIAAETTVVGVVTQPDKPVGRKQVVTASAVKQWAQEHLPEVPILQPRRLGLKSADGPAALEAIAALQPDLIVLVVYGNILPQELLDIPRFGCVNVHPSLLPKYRGASPMQSTLLHGDTESGISIMQMDAGMDTGPVLLQYREPLSPRDTIQTLHDRYSAKGAELLITALKDRVEHGKMPTPQPEDGAILCGLLKKEDGQITATDTPIMIDRKFRAYHPWPGIFTIINGKRIKILDLTYHADTDSIEVHTVQLEGKTPRDYKSFIAQYPEFALFL